MGEESWSGGGQGGCAATAPALAPAPVNEALPPGTRINQYEILRTLGVGGMSRVYLARDRRLGRRVAIKFLQAAQPGRIELILDEARATALSQHENIVVIHDIGEHAGAPYLVLEYLDGKPLTALLEHGQRLPYARAVEIACSILCALQAVHEAGFVHRDLKPDNIFVTASGAIKVLDFGIALVQAPSSPSAEAPTVRGRASAGPARGRTPTVEIPGETGPEIAGTLPYMSPEQWGIGIEIDHLTDIWACGLLLHQMICGRPPLPPARIIQTADLELPMPSMAAAAPPGVPPDLIRVVDRCLHKHKARRWRSAAELLGALVLFLPSRRTRELQIDESPYGLAPFLERDEDKFIIRAREIGALVEQLRDRPLVVVVGDAGVGKSSFVRAGVIPALKRSGEPPLKGANERWEALVIRPGPRPIEALAQLIQPMVARTAHLADDVEEMRKLAEALRRDPGHLGQVLRLCARRDARRLLLFVDQLEDLYTRAREPAEREAFIACLAAVAHDAAEPLRVVLSIRADFLGRVEEDRRLFGELVQELFSLRPLSRGCLRDALTAPAEAAGFQIEPEVVEDMLDHLEATPGALPLLHVTAARLWDARDRARRMLTHASYVELGGVAGALARHADRVVSDLGPERAPLIRQVLLRLVAAGRTRAIGADEPERGGRMIVPLAELHTLSPDPGEVQWLIERLVEARLLALRAQDGGALTVELVHESLVRGWPALRRWIDEHAREARGSAARAGRCRSGTRRWARPRTHPR